MYNLLFLPSYKEQQVEQPIKASQTKGGEEQDDP